MAGAEMARTSVTDGSAVSAAAERLYRREKRMTPRKLAQGAAAAALVLGATAILDAAPASARCRALVRGDMAHGALQSFTEISARSKWRSAVRARYGSGYTRWGAAVDKNVDCRKGEPGHRWHCRALARPCDGRG